MNRVICIAVAAFLHSSVTHAQTTLTAKWETGEKLRYVIDDKHTSKSTVRQRSIELQQTLILDTTWEAKRMLPNGGVELQVSIDRVQYSADGKGDAASIQNLTFDSDAVSEAKSKPEQGVADALGSYVGSVSAVSIDGRGHVTDFSISDELSERLKDRGTRELAGFFGDLFTRKGLKHRLTSWIVQFPAEPVSNGETWKQELPSRAGAKIVSVRDYTLVGEKVKDNVASVQIDVAPQLTPGENVRLKVTEQTGSGVVYLDQETHHIKEFTLQHRGRMTSFAEHSFDIVYSTKLQPAPHKGEQ